MLTKGLYLARLRRKHFLTGLAVAVALSAAGSGVIFALSGGVKSAVHQVYAKVNPVRIDLAAAQARLQQSAKADLALPLPAPRILICKEFKELTLFNGERFIKRYRVSLGEAPEGTYYIATHEAPRGRAPLLLALSKTPPVIHAALQSVQGGASAPAGAGAQGAPAANAMLLQGVTKEIAFTGAVGLSEDEAAELFVATAPGSPVTIEK